MKTLQVMLKLHKHHLDSIIQKLKETESARQQVEELVNEVIVAIEAEVFKYQGTEYSDLLIAYIEVEEDKLKKYQAQIHDLDKLIINLKDQILDGFAEVKKIELLIKNQEVAIKKKEAKIEGDMLDDISSNIVVQ